MKIGLIATERVPMIKPKKSCVQKMKKVSKAIKNTKIKKVYFLCGRVQNRFDKRAW